MVQEFRNLPNAEIQHRAEPYAAAALEQSGIKLALFSSGLGTINRGFEISTARFFRALHGNVDLDVKLYSGAEYPGAKRVWCKGRNEWLNWPLNLLSFLDREKLWRLAYILEQTSYSFGLIQESKEAWQPEVVWTKEVPLAHVLYEFRKITGNPYKIIFANGGGFRPRTYQQFDFIQHLQPEAYEEALAFGIPASKMSILPNAVPYAVPSKSKAELRKEYGYAEQDWIVICVAAWNSHHKRIDYLIEEVAKIDDPNCKLIVCGQDEPEAELLRKSAAEKMGDRARFVTVPEEKVCELLELSDAFALCSFYEGLGTVIIEAAMAGLPVFCHHHGSARYILQDDCWLVDMSKAGNLAARLNEVRQNGVDKKLLNGLKQSVSRRFNESKITADFENMVKNVHKSR